MRLAQLIIVQRDTILCQRFFYRIACILLCAANRQTRIKNRMQMLRCIIHNAKAQCQCPGLLIFPVDSGLLSARILIWEKCLQAKQRRQSLCRIQRKCCDQPKRRGQRILPLCRCGCMGRHSLRRDFYRAIRLTLCGKCHFRLGRYACRRLFYYSCFYPGHNKLCTRRDNVYLIAACKGNHISLCILHRKIC